MPTARTCFLERVVRRDTQNHCLHGSQRQCDIDISPLILLLLPPFLPPPRFFRRRPSRRTTPPRTSRASISMSDYPAATLRPGETSSISLRLQNYDMAPERLALSVAGVTEGLHGDAPGRRSAGGRGDAGDRLQRRTVCGSTCRRMSTMGTQTLTIAAYWKTTTNFTAADRGGRWPRTCRRSYQSTPQLPRIARHFEIELRISGSASRTTAARS